MVLKITSRTDTSKRCENNPSHFPISLLVLHVLSINSTSKQNNKHPSKTPWIKQSYRPWPLTPKPLFWLKWSCICGEQQYLNWDCEILSLMSNHHRIWRHNRGVIPNSILHHFPSSSIVVCWENCPFCHKLLLQCSCGKVMWILSILLKVGMCRINHNFHS